jgi:hypothetical protein
MPVHRGSENPSRIRSAARVLAGAALGVVVGLVVTFGFLAYRATVEKVYIHYWGELVGWIGLPILIVPSILVALAIRASTARFWWGGAALLASVVLGAGLGAVAGSVLSDHASGPWAGGLMGSGAATTLTSLGLGVLVLRPKAAVIVLASVFLVTGCRTPPDTAPSEAYLGSPVDTSEVISVIFLLGDPGLVQVDEHPVIPKMRQDVEHWSGVVLNSIGSQQRITSGQGEDPETPTGGVAMVVLGDVVYPSGMAAVGGPSREIDSARVSAQIHVLEGPAADSLGAEGIFIPGNHDWGRKEDWAGAQRLVRLQRFLEAWSGRAAGRLSVEPAPGTGGPSVVDLGPNLRLIALDTAWWLLGAEPGERTRVLDGVREALATAGNKRVVLAAHHPLDTGGPHGAGVDLGTFLGIRLLLKRAGILLQDLDSRPYSGLKSGLLDIFSEVRKPDIFAGGHDHSLQVFESGPTGRIRGLVVGSAVKLTGVTAAQGMLFGRSEPGYGKIFVLRDGSLHVEIEAAPTRFLRCGPDALPGCMEEALDSYRTVWREEFPRDPS